MESNVNKITRFNFSHPFSAEREVVKRTRTIARENSGIIFDPNISSGQIIVDIQKSVQAEKDRCDSAISNTDATSPFRGVCRTFIEVGGGKHRDKGETPVIFQPALSPSGRKILDTLRCLKWATRPVSRRWEKAHRSLHLSRTRRTKRFARSVVAGFVSAHSRRWGECVIVPF